MKLCKIGECGRGHHAKGYCKSHYETIVRADKHRGYSAKHMCLHRGEILEYKRQNTRARNMKLHDFLLAQQAEYRHKNKKEISARATNRRQTDMPFKLRGQLRHRVYLALSGELKIGSAVRDLGCSVEELKVYLESLFQPGMTWDNWGSRCGQWQIDHIVPLASFDLTDREQFLKACHYTNLQPLWREDHIKKSAAELCRRGDKK